MSTPPPLYIQEKVHPKVLIDDLLLQTKEAQAAAPGTQTDLFADFNGIPEGVDRTEFYQHDQNWSNRMILGDSLQASCPKTQTNSKPGAPGRFGLALRPELSVDEPRRVRKCERSRNLEWAGLAELLGDHESVR